VLIEQVFEDISGNTFVENPSAPLKDSGIEVIRFVRSVDQDHILGIYSSSEVGVEPKSVKSGSALLRKIEEGDFMLEDLHGEVLQFATQCPHCGTECQTNMKVTSILYNLQQDLLITCNEVYIISNWFILSTCT
jgi:zinc finger protein